MACVPIISWQIEEEKVEVVTDFLFLGSKITGDGDCSHEIRRQLLLVRKAVSNLVVVVQWLSHVWLLATTCTVPRQASLSITISGSLLKLISIELVMPSNHLILYCPLILLPFILPSVRVFSNESSSSHQVAKLLELQLQHQSFQWIFRTDFLRMDWLDLAVQGTLKSLLQHHSSKASILWHSAFLWSNSHIRTWPGKIIALIRQTFLAK